MKREPFITIGEMVHALHPEIFFELAHRCFTDVTDVVLAPAELTGKELYYAAIMQEPPKPGRGDG